MNLETTNIPPLKIDPEIDKNKNPPHQKLTLVLDIDGTLVKGCTTRIATLKYLKTQFNQGIWNGIQWFSFQFSFWLLLFILLQVILSSIIKNFLSHFDINDLSLPLTNIDTLTFHGVFNIGVFITAILFFIISWHHAWLFLKLPSPQTRAKFKKDLAAQVDLDHTDWSFIRETLAFVKQEHKRGRPLYLATGTDQKYAKMIAQALQKKLGCKDPIEYLASIGEKNMIGENKADALIEKFGEKNFIYAGNSKPDLKVWKHCVSPVIVILGKGIHVVDRLMNYTKDVYIISLNVKTKGMKS